MVLRGHRLDQDEWGEPGWSSVAVEDAYRRSEASFPRVPLRNPTSPTEAFVAAAEAAGHRRSLDLNGPDNEGVGLVPSRSGAGGAGALPTAICDRRSADQT